MPENDTGPALETTWVTEVPKPAARGVGKGRPRSSLATSLGMGGHDNAGVENLDQAVWITTSTDSPAKVGQTR